MDIESGLFLPPLAGRKRGIERAVEQLLTGRGFDVVALPLLSTLKREISETDRFKIISRDGSVLGLRYDNTESLIRVIASHPQVALPAKFTYCSPVFRNGLEVPQIGAEILGDPSAAADEQIISALGESLQAAGLADYLIDLGTVEVFKGLIEGTAIENGKSIESILIAKALHGKNESGLREYLGTVSLPPDRKAALLELPKLFGGEEVFARAKPFMCTERAAAGLQALGTLYSRLRKNGLKDKLSVDLCVVQELDYYTGPVFEAYSRRVGKPLASGGRYDALARQFGRDIPATGFALNTELILQAS